MSLVLDARTLPEISAWRAAHEPEKLAFNFLEDGENREQRISYGALDTWARALAAQLQTIAPPGERALLLFPTGLEFIATFLACQYAGVIAVPSIIPHLKRATPRLKVILDDAGATVACLTRELYEKLQPLVADEPAFQRLQWLIVDDVPREMSAQFRPVPVDGETVSFLQYTSGSTSAPKGVIITQFNLLETIRDLHLGAESDDNSVMVSWLPIFHDLGLIFGVLTPFYGGYPCHLMSPVSFLEKPLRWLKAIDKYQATQSAAPNFAFDLCLRKISPEERASLNLRSLTGIGNAAEPIRYETLLAFINTFAECGFHYGLYSPGYGLAEATVKVSGVRAPQTTTVCFVDSVKLAEHELVFVPQNHANAQPQVGCGQSEIGADIRIVEPKTRVECAPHRVGEIWVQSNSVAQGYWKRPEISAETFRAFTADGRGPYLRTGDMGFLHEGELYITGRIKDMVIVQGRNFYPQDIELTVERAHPALQPTCCAVFALHEENAERLVVVQEMRREFRNAANFEEIANAIRLAVAKQHGLRTHAVALIRPNTIAKTTSGKIQRHASRQAYLENSLETLYTWHAPAPKPAK